jgi:predicted ATPase
MHVAATICRRLDGLPLAIDLAAARAATLGLEAVAAGMDDRFRILTGGRRTDPPHHRTLEAAFDWSYDLLSDTGRAVASSLATLSGAFTLEEAIAVAGAGPESRASVLDGIADLVGKSLLGIDHREGATQYRFLDTTRAYLVRKARAAGVGAPGEAEPSRASSTALVRSFQKPLSKIQGPWRAHR